MTWRQAIVVPCLGFMHAARRQTGPSTVNGWGFGGMTRRREFAGDGMGGSRLHWIKWIEQRHCVSCMQRTNEWPSLFSLHPCIGDVTRCSMWVCVVLSSRSIHIVVSLASVFPVSFMLGAVRRGGMGTGFAQVSTAWILLVWGKRRYGEAGRCGHKGSTWLGERSEGWRHVEEAMKEGQEDTRQGVARLRGVRWCSRPHL